jgi:hypothetical protein
LLRLNRNLGVPSFDQGRGKSYEGTIELRAALGYAILMTAKIYALSSEVREAALDLKAVQRRIRDAGHRAYEWYPAQASARARMVALSLAPGADREGLPRNRGGSRIVLAKAVRLEAALRIAEPFLTPRLRVLNLVDGKDRAFHDRYLLLYPHEQERGPRALSH